MARQARNSTVVVIGLGRFGSALAEELYDNGHEVMGIDMDEDLVQRSADFLTFAEVCDATNLDTLARLGVAQVEHAVVAIGDSLQASILATANLTELKVPEIWAKALSEQHRKILDRIGATEVVFPEVNEGKRVAHRIHTRVSDYVELDDGFVLAEMLVPAKYEGQTVIQAGLREAFGVSVVCNKPQNGSFEVTTGDTQLGRGDLILVAGPEDSVDRFSKLVSD